MWHGKNSGWGREVDRPSPQTKARPGGGSLQATVSLHGRYTTENICKMACKLLEESRRVKKGKEDSWLKKTKVSSQYTKNRVWADKTARSVEIGEKKELQINGPTPSATYIRTFAHLAIQPVSTPLTNCCRRKGDTQCHGAQGPHVRLLAPRLTGGKGGRAGRGPRAPHRRTVLLLRLTKKIMAMLGSKIKLSPNLA